MSIHPALPTPPGSPPSSPASFANTPETSDPTARLDALLEIYLDRLDTYQRLRAEFSKNFSVGFLSLAHANRTGNLGSGRRYGEEGYDERMKAGRRVRIRTKKGKEDVVGLGACGEEAVDQRLPADSAREIITYTVVEHFSPSAEDSDDAPRKSVVPSGTITARASTSPPSEGNPSPDPRDPNTTTIKAPTTPPPASSTSPAPSPTQTTNPHPHPNPNSNPNPNPNPNPNSKSNPKTKKPSNPLHWYGVLVPPSLRAAQTSFTTTTEDQIPHLLNIQAELTDLESQIRESRTQAGLSR